MENNRRDGRTGQLNNIMGINPVVVIATHNRLHITAHNIESLLRQTVVPKIVLVVSCKTEAQVFGEAFENIRVVMAPNNPLGHKWQFGVDAARDYNANPLIITGSDDLLDNRFVERCCDLIEHGIDFIGVRQWYIYDEIDRIMHRFNYVSPQVLGAGRAYSYALLERMKWSVFDRVKVRSLDDHGYHGAVKYTENMHTIHEPVVLSVKGAWACLNPMGKILGHKNCKPLPVQQSNDEIFKTFHYVQNIGVNRV